LNIDEASTHSKQTTITPNIISELSKYLRTLSVDEKLFDSSRQTVWTYVKKIGEKANLGISSTTLSRRVQGAYTLLFRQSYAQQMRMLGADDDLTALKLRIKTQTNYGGYTIEKLKEWENNIYKVNYLSEESIISYVEWYKENNLFFEDLAKSVEHVLRKILDSHGIEYHQITSRAKSVESFENKIRRGVWYDPKKMEDLAGIRIICYVKSAVNEVGSIIKKDFDMNERLSHDHTKRLGEDKLGYTSKQYVVKYTKSRTELDDFKRYRDIEFEIQVRTVLQHAWAEIQHDKMYKNVLLPKQLRRRFNLVSGILEMADNEFQTLHEEAQKNLQKNKNF